MRSGIVVIVFFAASIAASRPAAAQVARGALDTTLVVVDPRDAASAARSAQAAFERARERHLPVKLGSSSGECDEVVGRFCTWHDEGEWIPVEDPEELRVLRAEFLATLDSLQALAPSDAWILGQRAWYRGEGGDWEGALAVARGCLDEPTWWCSALEGLALHGLGRFVEAQAAFDTALAHMDPELALEWRLPERAVDGDGREVLATVRTAGGEPLEVVLDRLWSLADPLYLVEGNDRETAHYARWTVATLKEDARNPYRMRWGRDLEELTVRHGWEVGWERVRGGQIGRPEDIVGHKAPEGRDYLPSGRTLADPTTATAEDLLADRGRPRSLYAPPYAPVLLPLEGQLARFPRGDRLVVVASQFLPDDTTFHATHDHPRPWLDAGNQAGMPDRIGLFAVPVDGGERVEATRAGSTEGALAIELPRGAWLISSESWSPEQRRAGRHRVVVEHRAAQPGAAILSDLLLLAPAAAPPESLEDALAHVLPRPEIASGDSLAIAWEVSGLGFRPETLDFEVSVERRGRNVFRRLGEILRLASPPIAVALAWEDTAPDRPETAFRHLDIALPELDEGTYEVTLTLRSRGRSDAVARREFMVR
jgi:tetratricopeptide (TPR) repeat protein